MRLFLFEFYASDNRSFINIITFALGKMKSMKKLKFLVFAVTATLTSFCIVASCAKEDKNLIANWVCSCEISSAGGTYTVNIPFDHTSKNDANTGCANAQNTYNTSGSSAVCVIK
jgi:hypothetical protein